LLRMRSALVTARTATLATSFQPPPPSALSVKEFEPTRWTQPTPKPFGRRVKKWLESLFRRRTSAQEEEVDHRHQVKERRNRNASFRYRCYRVCRFSGC